MQNFTPLSAAIGGGLIGLAVTLLWTVVGRTAGISSIAGGVLPPKPGDVLWRIAFLVGLPLGALLGTVLGPMLFAGLPDALPARGRAGGDEPVDHREDLRLLGSGGRLERGAGRAADPQHAASRIGRRAARSLVDLGRMQPVERHLAPGERLAAPAPVMGPRGARDRVIVSQ